MNPPIAYLLKMVLVSGVLYAYYHAVLRDKRFHQWNRFYLLVAVLLSVTLPLFHIPVRTEETQDNRLLLEVWRVLGKGTGTSVTVTATRSLTWLALAGFAYGAVVLVQLMVLGAHLLKLRRIHHRSPQARLQDVTLVTTEDSGTPFSFFRWIFWNGALTLDSEEGQRVLRHELTHVRQGHSVDKVLMQLLCAVLFPVLPLYWIRRELQLVHEYLADKQATENADATEYARLLISQAFQASPNAFANSFFQHPLKRRLAMMTRFSNPRFTYLRKMMFLPVALVLFGLLAFRVEAKHPYIFVGIRAAETKISGVLLANVMPGKTATTASVVAGKAPLAKPLVLRLTPAPATPVPDTMLPAVIVQGRPAAKLQEVTVMGYAQPKLVFVSGYHRDTTQPMALFSRLYQPSNLDSVLFIVDGKPAGSWVLYGLDPNKISSINVLKGESATAIYGLRGRNGVVEINLKRPGEEIDVLTDDDNKVFTHVEVEAQFPGGDAVWNDFVRKFISAHMDELQDEKKSGTCEIEFIVSRSGTVRDVHALSMEGTKLASISIAAIQNGPLWVPARQNGRAVTSFRRQKITFQMPDE